MATISFDVSSLNLTENQEQCAARDRIKLEDMIPIKGPPGTGKSTVISNCQTPIWIEHLDLSNGLQTYLLMMPAVVCQT